MIMISVEYGVVVVLLRYGRRPVCRKPRIDESSKSGGRLSAVHCSAWVTGSSWSVAWWCGLRSYGRCRIEV